VDADIVLDVRFLANPFFVPTMKHRLGNEPDVANFVLATPEGQALLRHVESLLEFTIPLYAREGKAYLTIAIGCTGGRHRSVAVADELGRRLIARGAPNVHVLHRDMMRGDVAGSRGSDPGPIATMPPRPSDPSRPSIERASGAMGSSLPPGTAVGAAPEPAQGQRSIEGGAEPRTAEPRRTS
jgi:hypothetical protein